MMIYLPRFQMLSFQILLCCFLVLIRFTGSYSTIHHNNAFVTTQRQTQRQNDDWCLTTATTRHNQWSLSSSIVPKIYQNRIHSHNVCCASRRKWNNNEGTKNNNDEINLFRFKNINNKCQNSNSRRLRLRQKLKHVLKTSLVAITIHRSMLLHSPNMAYASSSWTPFRGKPSIVLSQEQTIDEGERKQEIDYVPDNEHPGNKKDSSTMPKVSNNGKQSSYTPPAVPQMSLKDFEKFRKTDPTVVEEELVSSEESDSSKEGGEGQEGSSSSSFISASEKKRQKKFDEANAKRRKGGNKKTAASGSSGSTQDSVRLKRQSKRKSQVTESTQNSKIFQIATPVAAVSFATITFIRNKIRMDRERAFVEDNIEKLEQQKAEYFNVTGESLSDDDLMESLKAATGNVTVSDDDMDDDDEDDDDDDDDEYEYYDDDDDDDDDEDD